MPLTPYTRLVRLRPREDTVYAGRSRTVLATGRDGFVADHRDHGLFVHETRLVSRYRYLIDGEAPQPVALSNVEQHSWLGYYIRLPPGYDPGAPDEGSGQVPAASQHTLELRLLRSVGEGMHEEVTLTNFTRQPTAFRLELEVDADFADQIETGHRRRQRGRLSREWRPGAGGAWELAFDYRAEHAYDHQGDAGMARLHRGLLLRVDRSGSPPSYREGRLGFDVQLAPHGEWHACLTLIAVVEGEPLPAVYRCRESPERENALDLAREAFLRTSTAFTTPWSDTLAPVVVGSLERAVHDLAALRLHDLDREDGGWTMAAGLPIYVALFGRDTLTTAWQAAMTSPEMMRGTLWELARWQGTRADDWRDEQPGRMLHEAHTGPLAVLNVNPRSRYYGSITTSAFYGVVVAELWHWTGDKDLVRPLVAPALAALRWLDEDADADRDGFYEYDTRSSQGVKNQAWKDSGDAIVYEDGRQVPNPIATCEEQGFAYVAKLFLSEVLWWLGDRDLSRRLHREARELKARFNEAFWMDDAGFFAMGLDGGKRRIRSIGSNPGHCLATGIADDALVPATARRLMADDLFSGWGIRTLSSRHPAYNPFSYHRGSVWPVEHGTFAIGFMRYGLHDEVERICRAQFEAAALFDRYRLPELFSGHPRDADHPFPAFYPKANSPQAWSASSVVCLVQAMLGLYPYAPLDLLLVDPHLPSWLPELTLHNLRVGRATVTIRFHRKANGTSTYRVLEKRGTLHVVRQPSPWSLTAGYAERLVDALASLLPGR